MSLSSGNLKIPVRTSGRSIQRLEADGGLVLRAVGDAVDTVVNVGHKALRLLDKLGQGAPETTASPDTASFDVCRLRVGLKNILNFVSF